MSNILEASAVPTVGAPLALGTDSPLLRRHWPFVPSRLPWKKQVRRAEGVLLRRCPRPATAQIKPVHAAPTWIAFFAYCPDGMLNPSQRFSLHRLRDLRLPILVVIAAHEVSTVPPELTDLADALIWKSPPGYDFSAYTLALEAISSGSPGATLLVMNDSVFGPFQDIKAQAAASTWDLTGWTACGKFQNHLQSYAFSIRSLDPLRLAALRSVFFKQFALMEPLDVILCQETRLAAVAARTMSVGALWCPADLQRDAPIEMSTTLLRQGFPFLKKSLLNKYKRFQEPEETRHWLEHFHHPLIERT